MMTEMNLAEWGKLTVDERKQWLKDQSPKRLSELLVIIADILNQTDQFSKNELSSLGELSSDIIMARDNTYTALRDIEQNIGLELRERTV